MQPQDVLGYKTKQQQLLARAHEHLPWILANIKPPLVIERYCVICGKRFESEHLETTCSAQCSDIEDAYGRQYVESTILESFPKAIEVLEEIADDRVYFIQDSASGHIKIGMSRKPEQRMADLQVAHSARLVLLGHIPGDRDLEGAFHERFGDLRLEGEWFEPDDDLVAFIAEVCETVES